MRGRQNIIDPGDFRSETKSEKARASANVNLLYVLACGGSGPPRGFLAANRHVFLFAVTGLCPFGCVVDG